MDRGMAIACLSEPAVSPAPEVFAPARDPPPTVATRPTMLPQEPLTIEFSGMGDDVVGPFDLREGVVRFAACHSGSRNFVVKFIGEQEGLSINATGGFRGSRAHQV